LSDEKKLLEKIIEAKKEIEEKNLNRVNITDKDSRLMLMSNGGYDMSYNTQISVDSKNQIILSSDVVNRSNDYGEFENMYEQLIKNTNQKPREVSADAGYSSGRTLNYIKKNQIDAYIPDGRMNNEVNEETSEERLEKYDRRNFRYEKDTNKYICPEGKPMHFERNSKRNGVKYKIYRGSECKSCSKRGECISKRHQQKAIYRVIQIYENDDIKSEMRKKLLTKEGKKKYRKRLSTVEPVFAHIKHVMGFKQFLLRGIKKVKTEFSLICTSHNIKKLKPVLLAG
jgi:transposase